MRFTPSDEQRDFAASLADLLGSADTVSVARSWASGDYAPGRKLWGRLAEAGVTALGAPENLGGFGATAVDLVIAFEELGRFAVPGPLVESIAVLPVLLADSNEQDQVAAIAGGELVATLAMAPHVPYALDVEAADRIFVVEGSHLSAAVKAGSVASVDKVRRLAAVTSADRVASDVDDFRAFEIGVLCTAAQILGAGRALLDKATVYAQQRHQFGRAIGEFQAVKHQLADALVGIELARPLLFGAAIAYDRNLMTLSRDTSAAKVACTDAAYRAARTSLQVHGAIGYTSEYELSIWLTKVRALMSAWGTAQVHRTRVLIAL